MSPEAYRHSRRAEVGAELRRLRLLAGLGGREMAQVIGGSQSKVSRIESGLTPVSVPEIRAWARAAGAPAGDLARLEILAEQAVTETIALRGWREAVGGDGMQREIAALEASAHSLTGFQPCFVPGLLQTAEYARRVLATLGQEGNALEAMLAARLERQVILHDATRRFEFILAEAALRWHSGAPAMLVPQLDRIGSLATLANVTLRVVPTDADMHTAPVCAFWLYDERGDGEPAMAAIETVHARLAVAGGPEEVQAYRDEIELLQLSALPLEETADWLRDLAGKLS